MVTARAEIPWLCVKSFSSCFWDIGHRASSSDWNSFTVCAPCAAQAMSRFVCKKSSSVTRTSFFACRKPPESSKSMTLRGFGGHFACFSQKDSFKVWRGRGLYSEAECGKVYTINLDGSNMNDFVVECFMLR